MSNKRFMQGLDIKIDKVLKLLKTVVFVILELKEKEKLHSPPVYPAENKKSQLSGYNVTLSH